MPITNITGSPEAKRILDMVQNAQTVISHAGTQIGSQKTCSMSALRYYMQTDCAKNERPGYANIAPPRGISFDNFKGIYYAEVISSDDGDIPKNQLNNRRRGSIHLDVKEKGRVWARMMTFGGSVKKDKNGDPIQDTVTGNVKQPEVGDFVICAFLNNDRNNCVILGTMPHFRYNNLFLDKNNQAEPSKHLDVHPSYLWRKINRKGDFELYLPDNTFISIKDDAGSASFPSTPPAPLKDLSENRNPAPPLTTKVLTISHSSGTWVRIKADGTVEVVTAGNANFKVNGNMNTEVSGNYDLNVGGYIRFLDGSNNEFLMHPGATGVGRHIKLQDGAGSVILMDADQGDVYVASARDTSILSNNDIILSSQANLTGTFGGNVDLTIMGNSTTKTLGNADWDVVGSLQLAKSSNNVNIAMGSHSAARQGDPLTGTTDAGGPGPHTHTLSGLAHIGTGSTKVKIGQ